MIKKKHMHSLIVNVDVDAQSLLLSQNVTIETEELPQQQYGASPKISAAVPAPSTLEVQLQPKHKTVNARAGDG